VLDLLLKRDRNAQLHCTHILYNVYVRNIEILYVYDLISVVSLPCAKFLVYK